MQESIVASKVKEAFMGDKGLSGVVRKAPLEKVFEIGNVKKVRETHSYYCTKKILNLSRGDC